MNIAEYNEKRIKIESQYENAKRQLNIEYAMSNAKFKIGDIIMDSRWILMVDKITTYVGLNYPEPVYHGVELKKDLTPKKKNNRVAIYGNNAELIKR